MKPILLGLSSAVIALALPSIQAAAFRNLDFEEANAVDPSGWPSSVTGYIYPRGSIDPAIAFPGWSVSPHRPGSFDPVTGYNDTTAGSSAQILIGPHRPDESVSYMPLEGAFSARILIGPLGGTPFLSQTGFVPDFAKYLSFQVGPGQSVEVRSTLTIDGQFIPLSPIGGGRLMGNIAAFAGREATLKFSLEAPSQAFGSFPFSSVELDDIQFSIPEPSTRAAPILFGLAGLMAGRRFWRRQGEPIRREHIATGTASVMGPR